MRSRPKKPQKTLGDYLGIAVGPLLIILMVDCLVFFLLDVAYRGEFLPQLRWTLFWFVLAAVLISRIAIEHGSNYASLYGLALAAATAVRLTQFIGFRPFILLLLGLIWWCASKLTWDCTLIDEDADASGEGLLQRARLAPGTSGNPQTEAPPSKSPDQIAETRNQDEGVQGKRPHAPGLWVIYFSLGVLPVLAVGELTLPRDATDLRFRVFLLAFAYIGAALGLLLCTSFLGLRRYLRQRYLVMPEETARIWIAVGAATCFVLLILALFLPRPRGVDTLAQLGEQVRLLPQRGSEYAQVPGDAAPGEGDQPGNETDAGEGGSPESAKPARDGAGEPRESQDGEQDRGSRDDAPAREKREDQTSQRPSEQRTTDRRQGAVHAPNVGEEGFRWLVYALGLLVTAFVLFRFGREWLRSLREAWSRKSEARPPLAAEKKAAIQTFASFRNPFASGQARRMTPSQLIVYTFDALQAWAREHGWERQIHQTPSEFSEELSLHVPELGGELQETVGLYVRVAYAKEVSGEESVDALERLWSAMVKNPAKALR